MIKRFVNRDSSSTAAILASVPDPVPVVDQAPSSLVTPAVLSGPATVDQAKEEMASAIAVGVGQERLIAEPLGVSVDPLVRNEVGRIVSFGSWVAVMSADSGFTIRRKEISDVVSEKYHVGHLLTVGSPAEYGLLVIRITEDRDNDGGVPQ